VPRVFCRSELAAKKTSEEKRDVERGRAWHVQRDRVVEKAVVVMEF
jgi:hypothetical protein